jgi:serine/threonine-protein kinase
LSDDHTPADAETGVGAKVAGYTLQEQIGRGGMAVVFRAHDERLDRRVALKLLAPGLAADTAFRLRFIRESRAAAAVDHPNIIPVYDAGDSGGSLFIAMRYVDGGDARSALREAGALPPARAWAIITQVAAALDAAHARGLIHRDVKPANMLLDAPTRTGTDHGLFPSGQTEHVYLSDFGISKQSLSSHLTSTGQFVGTLDYVAPEQIEGREIDGRADQYSLACAAYELLSGNPPFRRDQGLALLYAQLSEPPPSLSASRPGLSSAVDQVLAKALAKTAAGRYTTCSQFAAELGRALNLLPGSPGPAGPPGTPDLPSTAGHPKPWPATELAGQATGGEAQVAGSSGAGTGQPVPAGAAGPGTGQPAPAGAGSPAGGAVTPPGGLMPGVLGAVVGVEGPTRRPPQAAAPEPTMLAGSGAQAGSHEPGQPSGPGAAVPTGRVGQADPAGQPGQYPQQAAFQQQAPHQQQSPHQQQDPYQQQSPHQQQDPYQQQSPHQQPAAHQQQDPYQQPGGWAAGAANQPGSGWPTTPSQPPAGRSRRSPALIIGAVVAVAAIAATVTVVKLHSNSGPTGPTGSSSPSASASSTTRSLAATEATAVNNLLTSSAASRMPLETAVSDVQNCVNLAAATTQIQQVVNQRKAEYDKASSLSTGALTNGATLKNDLMQALLNSLDADRDYLAWARQELNVGCPTSSPAHSAALNADGAATNAKQAFVSVWNPIAISYGFAPTSASSI